MPFETRNAGAYVLAFDNTAPLATGVAIANLSNQAANVGMTLRDDAGGTLQTTTIPVPANGHYAFVLGGVYPLAAGRRGTVEFSSAGAKISVLDAATVGKWRDIARDTAWKDYSAKTATSASLLKLASDVSA